MTLREQFVVDMNVFLSDDEDVCPFAEAISYTPDGGSPKTISAIIDPAFDVNQGTYIDEQGTMLIRSDATKGIASPASGDTFVWTERNLHCRISGVVSDLQGAHELNFVVGEAV